MRLALNANVRGCRWVDAFDLFGRLGKSGVSLSIAAYGAAVGACEVSARWCHAIALSSVEIPRKELHADTVTYNGVVGACGKAYRWRAALGVLLLDMSRHDVRPSLLGYCFTTAACTASARAWQINRPLAA
eukprot:CAMPEP_0117603268 /NCGR_PEP_ID=MMETSP0784-20121206/78045_1 /TAXON_ID=39447 /ORGANISM="" /LENGTH=130 /DNA_ID=CAMNT_0005406185 /DNA_START=11 /DNA_END=400 /DNA_ORIENTATION=+